MVGSNPGGRLSTTNQPRSSSDLAAVDRPAPDMPVMTTMSAGSSAVLIMFPCLVGAQRRRNGSGQPGSDARHRRDLLDARRAELTHRAELLEQRLAARRAEPGHVVQGAGGGGLAALGSVLRDREPVRLVPHPLQP